MHSALLDTHDDARLLALIRDGNGQAFSALLKRHADRFYRLAYRYVAHEAEAEDIVQEAFLKLWERPDRWQPEKGAAFTTWFYRLVINESLDRQKKKRHLPWFDGLDAADDAPQGDEQMVLRQRQRLLESAIAQLPERQQTALNLCFYEELSNQQAADIMQIDLKALQSLIMRAKTTLKARLGAIEEDNRYGTA